MVTSIDTLASAVSSVMIFCASAEALSAGSPSKPSMVAMCCDIFLAGFFGGIAGAEIVVALRQAEPP